MSIKPDELKQSLYISRENFQRAQSLEDEYAMHKCYISKNFVAFGSDDFVALQAIPDTHRVVPIKPTPEMINAALPHAMRESDEDKYRAIGMIICIWDEMLAAYTATASQGGE